jgi:hypothetical protein
MKLDCVLGTRRTLAVSRNHNDQRSQAWAVRILGEIASYRDPPEVENAEDPLVAHCGKLDRGTGKRAKPWTEQVETEKRGAGVTRSASARPAASRAAAWPTNEFLAEVWVNETG